MMLFVAFLIVVSLFTVPVRGSSYFVQTIFDEFNFKYEFNGVWVDSLGTVYFARGNRAVQTLTPAGDTAVIIGPSLKNLSGISAPAKSVKLDGYYFLHGDTSGNLYISSGRYFVWKYDRSSGIVSRIAGATPATKSFSGDGGQATAAYLNSPQGIYLSSNGVLYIADTNNNRIRTVDTATRIIQTFAGTGDYNFYGDSGQATSASLNGPTSVWGSSDGVIYIADYSNNRIRQVETSGIITTFAGSGSGGYNGDSIPATSAKMRAYSIYLDSDGSIFFTDPYRYRVRVIKDGIINTIAGNGNEGGYTYTINSANTSIPIPLMLGSDPTSGVIYFTSQSTASMLGTVLTAKPTKAPTFKPTNAPTTASPSLQLPERGSYYYMQTIIDESKKLSFFGGIWVDSVGTAYFARVRDVTVQTFTTAGKTSVIIGPSSQSLSGISGPARSVQLDGLRSIYGGTLGDLYVSGSYFIWKYDRSSGIVSRIAGALPAYYGFSGDGGQATAANLFVPSGLFLSSNGVLFLADSGNNRVRTINTTTGIINTFAGNGVQSFAGDLGPATSSSLSLPLSVWGSSDGVMYIADVVNNRIRQVDTSGIIRTFAGNGHPGYNGEYIPATLSGLFASSICGDSEGNIFLAEPYTYRIRVIKGGFIHTIAGNGLEGSVSHTLKWANSSIPGASGIFSDPTSGVIYYTSLESVTKLVPPRSIPKETPTITPTATPSFHLTETPTITPTATPSFHLTETPTITPTATPSFHLTETPTITPTATPSFHLTETPTSLQLLHHPLFPHLNLQLTPRHNPFYFLLANLRLYQPSHQLFLHSVQPSNLMRQCLGM